MFACQKKKKKYFIYVSKHNSNCEKQVILLMISNGEIREAKAEGHLAKSKGQQMALSCSQKTICIIKGNNF